MPFSYGVLALKKTVEYDIAGNSVIKKNVHKFTFTAQYELLHYFNVNFKG